MAAVAYENALVVTDTPKRTVLKQENIRVVASESRILLHTPLDADRQTTARVRAAREDVRQGPAAFLTRIPRQQHGTHTVGERREIHPAARVDHDRHIRIERCHRGDLVSLSRRQCERAVGILAL